MDSEPLQTDASRYAALVLIVLASLSLVLTACGNVGSAQSPTATATDSTALHPDTDEQIETSAKRTRPIESRDESAIEPTVDDGFISETAPLSPFDIDHPALANLDPALLRAVQAAADDASVEGVVVLVTSGWRSERYQQALLDAAIVTYGSEEEARRWVSTPDLSAHVTGEAVDIGPPEAAEWFREFGSRFGLCQSYANESWHYQLGTEPGGVCPEPAVDASFDRINGATRSLGT